MKIIILIILFTIIVRTEYTFQVLIDIRACPGCSLAGLNDLIENLSYKYPNINRNALVVCDDVRELKSLQNEYKNIEFFCDSEGIVKNKYKVKSQFSLILLDNDSNIVYKSLDILHNQINYTQIDSILNNSAFTKLIESDDNFIMFANSGSESPDGSKICIFDYLNFRISEFNTRDGRLLNEIIITDTIPLMFKKNFTEDEWNRFYSENPNMGVKIQNCLYNKEQEIILTGYCVGAVNSTTLTKINDKGKIDTTIQYSGIPKNFIINIKNGIITIDSLEFNNYAQLRTKYYKEDYLISNVFLNKEILSDYNKAYIMKLIDLKNKIETPIISFNELKKNHISFREPIEEILQAHSIYNFKDDKLIFINSYNNIFFIQQNEAITQIEPKGTLKQTFTRDQEYDSESFLDSSKIQNFNKYFVHSITFDETNNFYVILYNEAKAIDKTLDIVIQKYNFYTGFQKEVKIDLNSFDDKFISTSSVSFKSLKMLTKWKNDRWKIMDLSKFID